MAFQSRDQQAIQIGHAKGLTNVKHEKPNGVGSHQLIEIELNNAITVSPDELAKFIEAIDRGMGNTSTTTIWLNIRNPKLFTLVEQSLSALLGYPAHLVVTYQNDCSLDSNTSIPVNVLTLLQECKAPGKKWHPIRDVLV